MQNINWPDQILNFLGVILGVLLAFYISSAAETKKDRKELKNILKSFKTEIGKDLKEYQNGQIPFNSEQAEKMGNLLASIQKYKEDGTSEQMSFSFDVSNYSPQRTTYLSIVSSGKLGLIEDLELRKEIANYYDVFAEEAIEQGKAQIEYFMKEIIPWMIENTDMMNFDDEDIVDDTRFSNRVLLYQSLILNKVEQYKLVSEAAESLLVKIEKEIE
ncbi:MAG: DUF6090 family protein [Bacteroidota bacterium]